MREAILAGNQDMQISLLCFDRLLLGRSPHLDWCAAVHLKSKGEAGLSGCSCELIRLNLATTCWSDVQ